MFMMWVSVFSATTALLLFLLWILLFYLPRQSCQQPPHKTSSRSTAVQSRPVFSLYRLLTQCLSPSLPGPPSLPLLGNMLDLTREHLPSHLTSLARYYGSIYRLRCGKTTIVVLSSAEMIREALVKKWPDFAGRPHSYTGDLVSGGGFSISLGDYSEEWKMHRRLVHSTMQRCCAQSLHAVIERQALALRQVILDYKESPVDLSKDFTVAASNVITSLVFGKEYNKSSAELQCLHDCLNEIVSLWGSPWISALDNLPFLRCVANMQYAMYTKQKTAVGLKAKRFPNPPFSRLLEEVKRRDEIIRSHLKDCKRAGNPAGFRPPGMSLDFSLSSSQKGVNMTATFNRYNIRTKMLMVSSQLLFFRARARQEASHRGLWTLTETQVHMATVDLLIGGTETTAAWLYWMVAFLLHRPEVQFSVYNELCTVLDSRYPRYSDRHRLPCTSSLISEVLRLRPVAPLAVPHRATKDSSIAGYFIPKDTIIIPNLYGAHHDHAVWDDPDTFKPERFLEGKGASTRALVPFGGGARLCLGESIAKMELFLFTAYLLRDFQFLPAGNKASLPDLKGVASVVLKAKPFHVIVVPRP